MIFTPTQKELFNKNIEALSNILLKEGLKEIKSSKFELVLGKDNLDINLKDTSDNTFLYENVIDELNTMLNTYNDKYLLYPVLYFYGFGNGILFKALLQNKNHQHIVSYGNDPLDALQGIEQFVYNLPQMITHPSYKELLSKRKGISDTAIIVSTGPSLTKQLPLLKKYANKATIFCADSSYPILAKHGIKPDYVLSLERIPLTSEFFNNDFGEFDKDIVFVCAGVVHPKTIEYLKNKTFIITQKILAFPYYINLKNFCYAAVGFSVAHMAYEFATHLSHKNIIFIGQDLAYAEDGFSHTKDYSNLDKHEGHFQRDKGKFQCLAYGGNGKAESSEVWTMFRFFLQDTISRNIISTTYNCTEGGARIEGTIEKPFLWACEKLLYKDLNKPFEKLEPLSLNKQNEFLLKA
uniref:motility associated factor glycosyltransferase family protein n=1 Tax=Campylobacter coli TaxID=195 RepID=UPI000A8B0DEA